MAPFSTLINSTIFRKIIMALTALCLVGFIIVHLGGNLTLFAGEESQLFNQYAHHLMSLGIFLYIAEAGLVLIFLIHMLIGISIWWQARQARPAKYAKVGDAGGPSQKTFYSKNMIVTGILIGVFVIVHLINFKFGAYYTTEVHGEEVRDLYRLVAEFFANPVNVIGYVVAMLILGFHLRHGFWSAFQSLGVNHPRYSPIIFGIGIVFAIVMAVGFLLLPIYMYLMGGAQ